MTKRFLFTALGLAILVPFSYQSDVLGDMYIVEALESIISRSELIVRGKVVDVESKRDSRPPYIATYTTLFVTDVIKDHYAVGDQVVIRTSGGVVDGISAESEVLAKFYPGEEVLVLLHRIGDALFETVGACQGKFSLVNGYLAGTLIPVEEFVNQVRGMVEGSLSHITIEVPSPESQNRTRQGRAKVAHTGYHLSGQFYGRDSKVPRTASPTLEFHINPTGAKDKDGNDLSFNDIKAAFQKCINQWNNVPNTYLNYTIAGTATSDSANLDDKSVICWGDLDDGVGATAGAGVKIVAGEVIANDIILV